jgi:hypothetical protein
VEQESTWCQEAMSSILDTMAKKIRICARSQRWWNANIQERRKTVGRERRRRRNSEEAAEAKAELQRVEPAVEEKNVGQILSEQHGSRGVESGSIANP